MAVLWVPFHLDEQLPGFAPPVPADRVLAPELPAGAPWERMALLYAAVADEVAGAIGTGAVPVVLSGDCTTALGAVAGLQRGGVEPVVVWFDAHGDVQTPETSASGYLGGFPLRQLVGGSDRTAPDRLGLRPVPERDVVLVDARDLDPPEAEFLAASAIVRVPVDAVVDAVAARHPGRPLHLHLDADVVDPGELPALRFPAPGGPSAPRVLAAVRGVAAGGAVVAATIGCTWRGVGSPGAAALVREAVEAVR